MKKISLLIFVLCSLQCLAQDKAKERLQLLVANATSDTLRARLLDSLANHYLHTNTDTALRYAYQALQLAEKADHPALRTRCKLTIGYIIGFTGNYVKGIQTILEAKELAERYNYTDYIAFCYHQLGNNYKWQKNFRQAAIYYNRVKEYTVPEYATEMNLGIVYLELNQVDSALMFASAAYQHCLRDPEQLYLGVILSNLGRIHQKMGNLALGRNYVAMSQAMAIQKHQVRNLGFALLDISAFFKDAGMLDSAVYYSKEILVTPGMTQYKPIMLDAAKNLADFYTKKNTDSAFKYLQLAMALKEELLGVEKTQQIVTLRYDEELRQQQLVNDRVKRAEDRNNNLQYAAITLALIVFVILFFLFSHSIIANQKLIRFLGIIALLIVFEFLNLLMHPWLGAVTHHSPVLMLLAMVCVAAMLIPLHHRLEHWITHKLVEKNNKIRLNAAKRVVAELEPGADA
jgi:tetratricopeptide (TPR) repeat protein